MMIGNEFEVKKAKRIIDQRGFFEELGRGEFKQANWSISYSGVLRGLHYAAYPKLVTCIRGKIFDVAVDCRLDTPDFGKVHTAVLERGSTHQAYIPAYFAHGFLALEDSDVVYMQGREWRDDEIAIYYRDPTLAIQWPQVKAGLNVSSKDSNGLRWNDFVYLLNDLTAMGDLMSLTSR